MTIWRFCFASSNSVVRVGFVIWISGVSNLIRFQPIDGNPFHRLATKAIPVLFYAKEIKGLSEPAERAATANLAQQSLTNLPIFDRVTEFFHDLVFVNIEF